jgi:hypothetical protein
MGAAVAEPVPVIAGEGGVVAADPVVRTAPANSAPVEPASLRRPASVAPRRRYAESISDYSYVAGDLKRIGLFAGSLVLLLVVLYFIVR